MAKMRDWVADDEGVDEGLGCRSCVYVIVQGLR